MLGNILAGFILATLLGILSFYLRDDRFTTYNRMTGKATILGYITVFLEIASVIIFVISTLYLSYFCTVIL